MVSAMDNIQNAPALPTEAHTVASGETSGWVCPEFTISRVGLFPLHRRNGDGKAYGGDGTHNGDRGGAFRRKVDAYFYAARIYARAAAYGD